MPLNLPPLRKLRRDDVLCRYLLASLRLTIELAEKSARTVTASAEVVADPLWAELSPRVEQQMEQAKRHVATKYNCPPEAADQLTQALLRELVKEYPQPKLKNLLTVEQALAA